MAANLGVPLTERGFANFSFEFNNVDETSRDVQRPDARALIESGNTHVARTAQRWGIPEVQYDYKFFGNVGLDLEEINSRLYAFGNYAERKMEGGFYWRNPNNRPGIFGGDPLEDGTPTVKVVDVSHDGRSGGCRDAPIRGNIPQFEEVANGPDCFSFAERFPGGIHAAFRRNRARLEHRLRPDRNPGERVLAAQRLVLRCECLLRREQRGVFHT